MTAAAGKQARVRVQVWVRISARFCFRVWVSGRFWARFWVRVRVRVRIRVWVQARIRVSARFCVRVWFWVSAMF